MLMRRSMATTSNAAQRRGPPPLAGSRLHGLGQDVAGAAQPIRSTARVAAAGGHLRRHSSLAYHSGYAGVVVPGIWPPGARNATLSV